MKNLGRCRESNLGPLASAISSLTTELRQPSTYALTTELRQPSTSKTFTCPGLL